MLKFKSGRGASVVTGLTKREYFLSIFSIAVFHGEMNKLKKRLTAFVRQTIDRNAATQNTVLPLVGEERFDDEFGGEGVRFYAKVSQS